MKKQDITFESAMKKLDGIVARLDTGDATLEESLGLFSEGASLLGFCSQELDKAEMTIETLFPESKKQEAAND